MDIRAFIARKAPKRSEPPAPGKVALEPEKPRITPARPQQTGGTAGSRQPFVLQEREYTPKRDLERFTPKDITPLPEDYDQVLQALTAANPETFPRELGQGQTITNPARFITTHIQALQTLRSRPGSMLFSSYYRRARAVTSLLTT